MLNNDKANPAPKPDTSPGVGEGTPSQAQQQPIPGVHDADQAQASATPAPSASQNPTPTEQPSSVQQAIADAQAKNPTFDIAQVLKLPEVQAEIAKAARKAAQEAKEKAIEEMRKQAEREKMDEVERLKLEKAEIEAKAKEAEQRAIEATLERDLVSAIVALGVRPQDENALEFIRYKAFQKAKENDGMPMSVAVKEVIDACPWVLKKDEPAATSNTPNVQPSAAQAAPQYPQQVPPRQPTTAPMAPQTSQPAQPAVNPPVDTLKMSKEEYQNYLRRVHNFH